MVEKNSKFDHFIKTTLQEMIEAEVDDPGSSEKNAVKQLILLYLFILNHKEQHPGEVTQTTKQDKSIHNEDLQSLLQKINDLREENKTFLTEIQLNDHDD